MGRKLMRVPMDFAWPLGKVWGGYLNPFYHQATKCPPCDGTGLAPEAKRFRNEWYGYADFDPVAYGARPLTVDHPAIISLAKRNVDGNTRAIDREAQRLFELFAPQWSHHLIQADVDALVAAGRLMDFTRRPRTDEQRRELEASGGYWLTEPNGYVPTADEVNDWSMRGIGHDAINAHVCIEARCARGGLSTTCPACNGSGTMWPSEKIREAAENWEKTEPPAGDGYQLWETTSEGSPKSPVFATIEELCAWCADHATTFGSYRATASEWREMLDAGFVRHVVGNNVFM